MEHDDGRDLGCEECSGFAGGDGMDGRNRFGELEAVPVWVWPVLFVMALVGVVVAAVVVRCFLP